ncbi:hypothetical protein V8B97DRAFT_2001604 [Scleroderma yunnanense]
MSSSGAIKRARLEKEPMISYEDFVEDLDRGDSFTTSLIEVLVKELAERRLRQNTADRGLIADRTARSLRRLSSSQIFYRERLPRRGTGGRQPLDHSDYLAQQPDELEMDEEEDEFGPYGAFVPILNSDFYDYRSHYTMSSDQSSSDRVLPPLIDAPPPQRTNMWLPPPSGLLQTTLTRQNSIRRPGRSRTADFNEFTSHRRNWARQLTADEETILRSDNSTATASAQSADGMPSGLRSDDAPSSLSPHTTYRPPSSQPRRFFPFSRSRRFEVIPAPRPTTSTSEDWLFPPQPMWTGSSPRIESTRGDEDSSIDERSQAPRLRRGGLRAPEAMLSRHSPSWLGLPQQEDPSATSGASEGGENAPAAEVPEPVVPRPVSAEPAVPSTSSVTYSPAVPAVHSIFSS